MRDLSNIHMDIFLKHMTNIGKTDLAQMTLQPKNDMKHLYVNHLYSHFSTMHGYDIS